MSRVDDQARQQVLTRVAASRVRIVDAVESVRRGTRGVVRSFPMSATALKMGGVAIGGLVVAGMVAKKFSGKKPKKESIKSELKGRTVALQALSAVAIPLLQRWVVSLGSAPAEGTPMEERSKDGASPRFSLPDFRGVFYRWLGLQK